MTSAVKEKEKKHTPPNTPFKLKFGDVDAEAFQFLGIGVLNVETGRGELKARPGDFVVSVPGFKFIISQELLENMGTDAHLIPLEKFMDGKILNSKSGPDKFSLPSDPPEEAEAEESEEKVVETSSPSTSTATRTTRSAPVTRA